MQQQHSSYKLHVVPGLARPQHHSNAEGVLTLAHQALWQAAVPQTVQNTHQKPLSALPCNCSEHCSNGNSQASCLLSMAAKCISITAMLSSCLLWHTRQCSKQLSSRLLTTRTKSCSAICHLTALNIAATAGIRQAVCCSRVSTFAASQQCRDCAHSGTPGSLASSCRPGCSEHTSESLSTLSCHCLQLPARLFLAVSLLTAVVTLSRRQRHSSALQASRDAAL